MRVGSLFGVPLKVNPWFIGTLFGIALLGLLPQALVLFTSVLLHEMSHALVARGHGVKAVEIELLPFGGVARLDELGALDPAVERNIAIAGPLANLFIAAFCWGVQNNWPLYPELLVYGIYGNLSMAAVNLLPALPLDGGRIVRSYLAGALGYRKATRLAIFLARLFAVLLTIGGLAGAYLSYANISVPVVGIFLWIAARKEEYFSRYLFVQYITRRRDELGKRGPRPMESILCYYNLPVKEVVRHFLPQCYHLVYLINNDKELLGYVTELEVIEAMLNQGIDTPLGTLTIHPLGRE